MLGLVALAGLIIGFAWAETITLSTYYPAPYGVYKEFETKGKTDLAVDESGVGVGQAWPSDGEKLDVAGNIKLNDKLIFVDKKNASINYTDSKMKFLTGGENTRMVILADGNIGIGTEAPVAALEVDSGPIKATGGLILPNNGPASDDGGTTTGSIWLE